MAQTEPIDAYLGPARTGAAIGATLYQLDGSTVHAAFSTTGWYEAPAGSGDWHHAGLSFPDAGGVIAVGISGTEYKRQAVEARQLLYSEYTAPDNTTIGTINTRLGTPVGASISADIAGIQADTNDIQTRIPAALVGGRIDANVGAISSDATAADNAEAFFDGTGYAGTGNVIPTVTTVTNAVSANVTQISGDSTAADNLEAALDGTGGVTITAGLTGNVTGNLSGSVGSVTAGVSLSDGAITAAKIAADAITAAKIADGAIDAATFATGAITASAIAADAITDAKVASDVTIAAVTGAVGSVAAGVTVTTNNDKTGYGLADGAITAAKFGAGAITASVIATDAIDADALAADAVSEIQSGLATSAALATVDTVVDAILVDTAEIGAAGAGLTALATQTSVNTIDDFLDTEIAAIKAKTDNLPASPAATGDIPDATAIATAVWANATRSLTTFGTLAADVWAVATRTITGGTVTTNSDKEGYSLSTAGIQAIWDALTSALTTVGSIGKLFVDNINATIGSRSSHTAANVRTEMDSNSTQLAKLGTPSGASLSADVAAIKADTANIGAAGAGLTSVASAANLATLTAYVDTEVAAIKAKTDNLPASPANEATLTTIASYIDTEVAAILSAVDTEVAAIKAVTDALPNGGALTTITSNVAAILLDTGTDGVVVAAASKTGYSLSADQSGVTVGTVNSLGTTAQAQVNTQADTALADYDAPTKTELDTAQAAIVDAIPTAVEIDNELSTTHGAGGWATAAGFATPTNVANAQAAIGAAIAALNDLSTADIDARLTAYDGATQTDLTATQTAITNAIAVLNNLSQAQAQTAATAALNAYDSPTKAELDSAIDALPTAAEVWSYNSRTLTASSNSVTIVSAVNANTVTVFAKDTWSFTISSSALALASYEAIGFVAKASAGQSDSDALLYVRSDTGLVRIGGASATAGDGALTIIDGTSFSVKIAITATGVTPGTYRWWVKGFDTTPATDEGYTLATGIFIVNPAGLQAVS